MRTASSADAVLLAVLIIGVAALYSHYALRTATFQDDEELYMRFAQWIAAHFPSGLFESGAVYSRGLQRIDPLLLSIPFAFLRGPGAFQFDHVLQALLLASTALPTFLLARRAGLGRAGSFLAALLVLLVPWTVVATSYLTENAAYPAFAWLIYATWLVTVEPTRAREALAVLALVVAACSRVALIAAAPMLPVAAIWQLTRFELAGGTVARLRALPRALLAGRPLITVLTALAVLVYVLDSSGALGGLSTRLTGSYGLPHLESLSDVGTRYRYFLSRLVAGTGYVVLAVGAAWTVAALGRRTDPRRHALALVCLLGVLCTGLSVLQAGPDERYVMYAAVPAALAFVAALRSRPGWGVLVAAVLVVVLVDGVAWPPLANVYDFFSYPAAIFYNRVLVSHAHLLPAHPDGERVIEAAIVLVALAWLLARRHARTATVASVLLALAVVAFGAVQTVYALRKYTSNAAVGPPESELSWVDRHVPAGANVAAFADSYGASGDYVEIWRHAEFWNTSIDRNAYFGSPGSAPFPLGMLPLELAAQEGSGLVRASIGRRPAPVPTYMLVPRVTTLTDGFELAGARPDPTLLLELAKLRRPARLDWSLRGVSHEGFLTSAAGLRGRLFSGGLADSGGCASFTATAPAGGPPWRYSIASGRHGSATGTLRAGVPTPIVVHLEPRATPHGPTARFTLRPRPTRRLTPPPSTPGVRIESFRPGGCGAQP